MGEQRLTTGAEEARGPERSTANEASAGEPAGRSNDEQSDLSSGVDLGRVRDLVLAAHPDVVAEMVAGDTFDALMASVEPARAAYARIAEATTPAPSAPTVASQPGGGRQTYVINVEELSPSAKITEGLKRIRR